MLAVLILGVLAMNPVWLFAQQAGADAVQKTLQGMSPDQIEKLKGQLGSQQQSQPAPAVQQLPAQEYFAIQTEQEIRAHKEAAEAKEQQFEARTEQVLKGKSPKTAEELKLFGLDYFAPARKRVLALEEAIASGKMLSTLQKDALAGFVGPLDMVSTSVNASMPPL